MSHPDGSNASLRGDRNPHTGLESRIHRSASPSHADPSSSESEFEFSLEDMRPLLSGWYRSHPAGSLARRRGGQSTLKQPMPPQGRYELGGRHPRRPEDG